MNVKFGSRWKQVIAEAIESGRYASKEEFVNEALGLAAEKERRFRELKTLIEEAYEDDELEGLEEVSTAAEAAIASAELKAAAE